MTIKPFAIQGADLTLGGVNLQAGTTTIVIPGVTQAANYFVEEVDEYGSDDNQDFGSQEGAITIIDNAEYVYRSGGAQPSGAYVPAEYSVDELDDGNIEEVQVEVDGTFAAADKTRAEASNMWATLTPNPFASFNTANWTQIPFRPKMRAGAVETIGGGSGGVVERSIEFPQGESGDAAGTLALIPTGELYLCTTDWFDYSEYGGEYSGLVTTGEFLPSQTGFVSNAAFILRVDVPPEILYILQSAAIVPGDWEIAMADAGFGGTYTCTDVTFDVDNNPVFFWPYRNGTDPVGITAGSAFTVTYNGTVPQPTIWSEIATGGGVGDRLVNGLNEVVLDVNGNLTAPGDITTGTDGGRFIQDCDDGTTSMRWINVSQGSSSTQLIRVYTGDPDEENDVERAQIKLNWDQTEDKSGLTIRTFDDSDDSTNHDWLFKGDGVLQLPVGGDIVDSTGASVLGGSSGSVDQNIWIQTFASQDGFPSDVVSLATSVEYDNAGNIIALFSHQTGIGEFNVPSGSYFSVAKFTAAGQKLWQVRLTADISSVYTDGWGLAVDNVAGRIYVAGRVDDDVSYSKSSLIKLNSEDGSLIWSNVYDLGERSDSPVVDVDSEGDPIMVGYLETDVDTNDGITVTKISKLDGTVIWSRLLDGQNDDEAYGMAVGPNNEVVAIGYTAQIGIIDTVETVVAEPVSNVNWTNERPVFNNGFSCTVSFPNGDGVPSFSNIEDTIGNRSIGDTLATIPGSNLGDNGVDGVDDMIVKVATVTAGDTDDRMLVVKYDSTGGIQWQKAIQFDAGYACRGADADIDSQGNVYVCGNYDYDANGEQNSAMNLVKFDSSGVKQWSRRVVGDCEDFATSIVVGPDDTLYLNGITSQLVNDTPRFVWVVAKYTTLGTVVWQRLIENTTGWSFSGGGFFNAGGGSNLAVRQGYVALSGGFGEPFFGTATATVVQIDTDGTVFNVGDWEFKSASFSGTLNSTASDITVVNAEKVDSAITGIIVDDTLFGTDTTNFLIPTLYTAPSGDNSLVNGAYSVILGNTGAVTLPAGGTITEGYVTSNPTIQLTPASPDVASQKLVIKGGGNYNASANGIGLNWYIINPLVNDTVEIYVTANAYANQTLYWWIYPEGASIATPESGTVILNNGGSGDFGFTVDSDDYEFTVRVSPEANNYDPATGVETQLFNASAPTLDADHHLHLTTGNLAETSIFLGTDNHNVRTTTDGGIEITTPDIDSTNVWRFDNAGILTVPGDGVIQSVDNNGRLRSQLRLDQGSDITRLSAWSSPDNQSFTTSDWATGTYTNNAGAGVIEFTGAENIVSWLSANNYADRFFLTVNGGPQMESNSRSGGANDLTFYVATPPATSPTTVTSFSIYYQFESRLDIDTDDEEFYILATNNDLYLETRQSGNIQIRSVDDLDIVGNGIVTLRNNSATNGIEIRTDDGDHSWNFGVDGILTFPDGTTNSGDTVVSTSTYDIQSIGNTLIQTSANAGAKTWTFSTDGSITLPGAVVNSTVAKTGVELPTTTGVVTGLTPSSALGGLTDGTYGPFTLTGVTLSVVVFGGVINGFTNVSGTATVNDVLGTVDSGDIGGTAGTTITITVNGVAQETPTALDLTKTVNKLTNGFYTLADGVEGQIMYLVPQNGITGAGNVGVSVANFRTSDFTGEGGSLLPFRIYNGVDVMDNTGICTLIFTDGAWQQTGGAWD